MSSAECKCPHLPPVIWGKLFPTSGGRFLAGTEKAVSASHVCVRIRERKRIPSARFSAHSQCGHLRTCAKSLLHRGQSYTPPLPSARLFPAHLDSLRSGRHVSVPETTKPTHRRPRAFALAVCSASVSPCFLQIRVWLNSSRHPGLSLHVTFPWPLSPMRIPTAVFGRSLLHCWFYFLCNTYHHWK